jgi:hypothetical protein
MRALFVSWLLSKVLTPAVMKTLLGDLFAALRAGAHLTATPVDDVVVDKVEAALDLDTTAGFLLTRLRDLVGHS